MQMEVSGERYGLVVERRSDGEIKRTGVRKLSSSDYGRKCLSAHWSFAPCDDVGAAPSKVTRQRRRIFSF